MTNYDLIVIGGGSGGVRAARMCANYGARVLLCEADRLGGTCVNLGCVPKKLFVYAASFKKELRDAIGYGWRAEEVSFDWATLVANKDEYLARLNRIYGEILEEANVEVVHGRAQLVDANTIQVGSQEHRAKKILIATGGKPWVPTIEGANLGIVSDNIFSWQALPQKLVVVGGGYIAVEFSCMLHSLGVNVHLIHRGDHLLRGFDGDLQQHLKEALIDKGVELHLNTEIERITKQGEELQVELTQGKAIHTQALLWATGRHPNTHDLGLERVGIELDSASAIPVNETFQTSVPSIFALGDVINRAQLTPVALAEGMVFARRYFGNEEISMNYDVVPTAVFSRPEIASAGLSEEDARQRGHKVAIYRSTFTPLKQSLAPQKERALVKLVVEETSQRVLGVHMFGPHAAEIVQSLTVAISAGATKADFDATIAIHPTVAEEFVSLRSAD